MCEVEREMTKEEMLQFIRDDAETSSILYDLDLLPEQVAGNAMNVARMTFIVHLIKQFREIDTGGYAYKDIKEYADIVWPDKDFIPNEAFRIGWDMARTTNKMLEQLAENSGGRMVKDE